MKNILKPIISVCILLMLGSCVNDKDPIASSNGLKLRQDTTVTSPTILTPTIDNNVYTMLNWDRTDNGIPSVSKYTIIVSDHDLDPNHINAVEYTGVGINPNPDARLCTLKVSEFNALINSLPTFNCGVMNIDIRVKSVLGVNNTLIQYSNPITVAVTGYSKLPLILAFVKDGDSPSNASKILSSSSTANNDFEGYMYLEAGNYKFYHCLRC